jgi:hypothetical protein
MLNADSVTLPALCVKRYALSVKPKTEIICNY